MFLDWGIRHRMASESYREWLVLFRDFTLKDDITDVIQEDVDLFHQYVYDKVKHRVLTEEAQRALAAMIRFYKARGKNGVTRNRGGRPPAISQIRQAQEYQKKGLKLWEISKLLGSDKSLVHRWLKRKIDGLF